MRGAAVCGAGDGDCGADVCGTEAAGARPRSAGRGGGRGAGRCCVRAEVVVTNAAATIAQAANHLAASEGSNFNRIVLPHALASGARVRTSLPLFPPGPQLPKALCSNDVRRARIRGDTSGVAR